LFVLGHVGIGTRMLGPMRARLPWRWLVIGSLSVLAVGAIVVAARLAMGRLLKPVVSVAEVITLSPAQADVKVMASGYVVPLRHAVIASKLPGRLEKVVVREGENVEEGQLLATLESDDSRAAVNEAHAALATAQARAAGAKASLGDAKLQLDRERRLHQAGSSSAAALDAAQSRYDVAVAALQAAEAEVKTANARFANAQITLRNTRITAPFSGRVVHKLAEAGEVPTNALYQSSAGGIIELVDFASLVVEADVSESRIGALKLGGPAEITLDAFPNKRLRGEISEIRPTVDRQKATVLTRVKFVDPVADVLPQMAAKVLFLSRPLRETELNEPPKTVVPANAVLDRGAAKAVFVLSDGRVHLVPVVLGAAMGTSLELKQGPPPGTKVVLDPAGSLADGDAVKESSKG